MAKLLAKRAEDLGIAGHPLSTLRHSKLAWVRSAVLDLVAQLVEHARATGLQLACDNELEQPQRSL